MSERHDLSEIVQRLDTLTNKVWALQAEVAGVRRDLRAALNIRPPGYKTQLERLKEAVNNYPKTADQLAKETDIPVASVRAVLSANKSCFMRAVHMDSIGRVSKWTAAPGTCAIQATE